MWGYYDKFDSMKSLGVHADMSKYHMRVYGAFTNIAVI